MAILYPRRFFHYNEIMKTKSDEDKIDKLITFINNLKKCCLDDNLELSCVEIREWHPMTIKEWSKYNEYWVNPRNELSNNMIPVKYQDNKLFPLSQVIEELPTYIIFAHGIEMDTLPITLNKNEYVIMNCNPFTYSYGASMVSAHLVYDTLHTSNGPFNKLEQLLKYFHIKEKEEKKNKFCIFTNKCPNLSLHHKDNSTGSIVGTTMEWPLFEYPVQYLDKVNSDGEIDKNYYYNFSSDNTFFSCDDDNNQKCAKIIQDRKEELLESGARSTFFHTFNDTDITPEFRILSNRNTLDKEIELIRQNQKNTDRENIGFCLFINSCRSVDEGYNW